MNIFKRKSLSLALFFIVLLSGCSSSYALEDKNVAAANNNKKVRKIVQASSSFNANSIKNSIPGVEIIRLSNGRYIIISNSMDEAELQKRLSRFKNIRKIENPKNINIIKPIEKTPINGNTNISGRIINNDKAVNDPLYKGEWDISYTESNKAWALINQKREVKVAVLDTGIDYNHPDLKNRVLKDSGYNFVNDNSDVMDDNGHGTHVSGIIAAEANNQKGISGITGYLDVKIIPVKVLNSKGEGESDIIAKGIEYAADKGADIINLSFGCQQKSVDIENAIQYAKSKGALVVAASGNDNSICDNDSPAGDEGAFTVAAINRQDTKASFSDYGNSVQIASPGVKIISTVPGGKYEAWDGTSMAAPVVSGIAAMLRAENPSLMPDQIESILDKTAKDIMQQGRDQATGYGLVDAYNALQMVKSMEK